MRVSDLVLLQNTLWFVRDAQEELEAGGVDPQEAWFIVRSTAFKNRSLGQLAIDYPKECQILINRVLDKQNTTN